MFHKFFIRKGESRVIHNDSIYGQNQVFELSEVEAFSENLIQHTVVLIEIVELVAAT
ncbi:hypothetical protein OAF42_02815 [Planctomicrobium sp.]|nr:hypothetical protein [Planctomicrobium sp.]MDB4733355.1 hypothetical protein [Planctomicrobium sp.]